MSALAVFALAACASTPVELSPPPEASSATAEAAAEPVPLAVGADLSGQTLGSLDGLPLTLPDPGGRPVILELIRSADW